MFLTVKEITVNGSQWPQLDTRMKLKWQELLLFDIISNAHPSRSDYFCDISSSYIFKMRISNLMCFPWYKSTQFFFISRFLSSKYAPHMYNTAAWFVDCFSAFAIGQCQSDPKPCMGWCFIFPRNVIMLTPCFVFLTEPVLLQQRITVMIKNHILITPVFPHTSLQMLQNSVHLLYQRYTVQ